MSTGLQLALIPIAVAGLLAAMAAVHSLAGKFMLSAEVQRKSIHVLTGLFAIGLPWMFPSQWPAFVLLGLTVAIMMVLRLPALSGSGLGSTLHGVERQSHGDFLLVFAVAAILVLSEGDPLFYGLPIAVLALADAAAALAGSAYGRRTFPVGDGTKSLEGVAIFFLVTWILSLVALLLFSAIERENVVMLSLMIAGFGALVEADSWRGYDNLFVPLGVFLLLSAGHAMAPAHLGGLGAGFVAALVGACLAARGLGLSMHTARIFVVALFLIVAASSLQNVLLPAAALGAHLAARSCRPCRSDYPDLDLVAAIGVMSVAWLTLGMVTGPSSINFYGLAFAGLALLLTVLATGKLALAFRIAIVLAAGLALVAIFHQIVALNGPALAPSANRFGEWTLAVAATVLICVVPPFLKPDGFDERRAPKAALVSSLVPACFYLANAAMGSPGS